MRAPTADSLARRVFGARTASFTQIRVLSAVYLISLFIPVVIASYALATFWNAGGYVDAIMVHLGHQGFSGVSFALTGVVIVQL